MKWLNRLLGIRPPLPILPTLWDWDSEMELRALSRRQRLRQLDRESAATWCIYDPERERWVLEYRP